MKAEARIFKNTAVMILQPLILNVISLFVIGYISRKLGVDDFGTFNLAILFTTLFYPLGVLGMNSVSIRDISRLRDDRSAMETYVGKLLSLRLTVFLGTVLLVLLVATLMDYPPRTTHAIYIATAIVAIQLFSESICDVFTGFEKMEYTALVTFVAGLTLTGLSVLVLYRGYGLFAVLGVYAAGHLAGSFVAVFVLQKRFLKPKLSVDLSFWKEKVLEGLPFITMSLVWAGMMRLDTILLSKVVSMEELGFYTAGMLLVTKVNLIPEAVGSSIYPAASSLYASGRTGDIERVTRETLSLMAVVALPICIGCSLYGSAITGLVFGHSYERAGWILSVAIWAFFFRCFMFVQFNVLAAMRKQKNTLRAYLIAGAACFVLNFGLTYSLKTTGALIAFMGSQVVLLGLFTHFIVRDLPGCLRFAKGGRIVALNFALALFLVLIRSIDFVAVLILSAVFYLIGTFALEIITVAQIKRLKYNYGK